MGVRLFVRRNLFVWGCRFIDSFLGAFIKARYPVVPHISFECLDACSTLNDRNVSGGSVFYRAGAHGIFAAV